MDRRAHWEVLLQLRRKREQERERERKKRERERERESERERERERDTYRRSSSLPGDEVRAPNFTLIKHIKHNFPSVITLYTYIGNKKLQLKIEEVHRYRL